TSMKVCIVVDKEDRDWDIQVEAVMMESGHTAPRSVMVSPFCSENKEPNTVLVLGSGRTVRGP
ncbi:MAG TPA: hypothetical protein VFO86_02935, partial [Terriglobia bacterium]|nr:hypothetical protein [Terriglobia bacterium]